MYSAQNGHLFVSSSLTTGLALGMQIVLHMEHRFS